MKYISLFLAGALAFILLGCSEKPKNTTEAIVANVEESVHPLTADERQRASTNAKAYFEKEWPVLSADGLSVDHKTNGVFNECRPSDSNANGLVTCSGMIPQAKGGFIEQKRYCGYTPQMVGCSDEDTKVNQ